MKKQKMFYTSDGVKIIGYSNAKEFNKALEEWTKKNERGEIKMINFKDLKKGDEIRSTQLGPPIDGKLMESPKQGKGIKKVILIYSKGSTVGMFDEHGSVYATDIVEVERNGTWHEVSHN